MDGRVGLTMEGLGLSHVQDTFVGNEQIRGVSRALPLIRVLSFLLNQTPPRTAAYLRADLGYLQHVPSFEFNAWPLTF